MSRREKFKERRRKRFRKSLGRFIFSILLVLAFSFLYDNMNLVMELKGNFASEEIVKQPVTEVSSVVLKNRPFAFENPIAYSESFAQETLVNDLKKSNIFIGNQFRNVHIAPDSADDAEENEDNDSTKGTAEETGNNSEQAAQPENDENTKTVYLTFDDGPNQFSFQLLDLLASYNAKATFFLIDRNIRSYPDAVNQMIASGHSVGLHSVSHNVKIFYQSATSVISEMDQVRNTVKEVTGIETMLIRTPYGSVPHMQDSYVQAVHDNGYLMWDWNIDSKDWYYRDRRYVDACISQLQARTDSEEPIVILLHERQDTLTHLPALLEYLKSENYQMKAIDSSMTPVAFK